MYTLKSLRWGVLFFSAVFFSVSASVCAEVPSHPEGVYASRKIPSDFNRKAVDIQPDLRLEETLASPDSISWDPTRYAHLPFLMRTKDAMGWSAPEIDTQQIFYEKNQDITDSLPADLLNSVSSSLAIGDIEAAKALLQETYGGNVEIIKN